MDAPEPATLEVTVSDASRIIRHQVGDELNPRDFPWKKYFMISIDLVFHLLCMNLLDEIVGVVRCQNPNCISDTSQPISPGCWSMKT